MAATDSATDRAAELRAIFAAKLRAELRAKLARLAVAGAARVPVPFFAWSPIGATDPESADPKRTAARIERAAAVAAAAYPRLDSVSTAAVTIAAAIEPMPAVQVFPEA